MWAKFFPSKTKTPDDVVKALRESLLRGENTTKTQPQPQQSDNHSNTVSSSKKQPDDISKSMHALKILLFGDASNDVEVKSRDVEDVVRLACSSDLLYLIVRDLWIMEFETRKDAVQIFNNLLRHDKINNKSCSNDDKSISNNNNNASPKTTIPTSTSTSSITSVTADDGVNDSSKSQKDEDGGDGNGHGHGHGHGHGRGREDVDLRRRSSLPPNGNGGERYTVKQEGDSEIDSHDSRKRRRRGRSPKDEPIDESEPIDSPNDLQRDDPESCEQQNNHTATNGTGTTTVVHPQDDHKANGTMNNASKRIEAVIRRRKFSKSKSIDVGYTTDGVGNGGGKGKPGRKRKRENMDIDIDDVNDADLDIENDDDNESLQTLGIDEEVKAVVGVSTEQVAEDCVKAMKRAREISKALRDEENQTTKDDSLIGVIRSHYESAMKRYSELVNKY